MGQKEMLLTWQSCEEWEKKEVAYGDVGAVDVDIGIELLNAMGRLGFTISQR
jgi:hypothetical protein